MPSTRSILPIIKRARSVLRLLLMVSSLPVITGCILHDQKRRRPQNLPSLSGSRLQMKHHHLWHHPRGLVPARHRRICEDLKLLPPRRPSHIQSYLRFKTGGFLTTGCHRNGAQPIYRPLKHQQQLPRGPNFQQASSAVSQP